MFILMKFNNEHYTVGWRQLKVRTSYKSLLFIYKVVLHFTVNFRSISVLRHHIFPIYFITESYS